MYYCSNHAVVAPILSHATYNPELARADLIVEWYIFIRESSLQKYPISVQQLR